MLVKGNQLCSFLSVLLRWCKHEYQTKKTTTSTFKSKQCCKYSLRWWKQRTSSTDNRILYRRSNFLRRRGSKTDRRRRWTQHERLRRRTGRHNPISDGVRSRAPSSVEIQNKAVSSFLIADTAASFACKCSQITTAEGAEWKVEQRRGCISQFSVNSDDGVVAFQLNIYNTKYCDKTILITLYGKQKST